MDNVLDEVGLPLILFAAGHAVELALEEGEEHCAAKGLELRAAEQTRDPQTSDLTHLLLDVIELLRRQLVEHALGDVMDFFVLGQLLAL